MTPNKLCVATGAIIMSLGLLSGCVVHTEDCVEECYSEIICDAWGCDEIVVCECVYYDDADYYDNYDTVECLDDYDCPTGAYCDEYYECAPNLVRDRPEPTGDALYCEPCAQGGDCFFTDSLCIELGSTGAKVCGLSCDATADCPAGAECLPVGQTNQCVPVASVETGLRVCGAVPVPDGELPDDANNNASTPECDAATACAEGQRCEDGVCVQADTCEPNFDCEDEACDADADCEAPLVCGANGDCVEPEPEPDPEQPQSCQADTDCDQAICLDGLCAPPECTMTADCGGAAGELLCVGGHCETACSDDAGCGDGEACAPAGYCEAL